MKSKISVLRPWEKAVEHSFILRAAKTPNMTFAVPLDGDAEAAGDTIFGAGTRCTLVEFKRDKTSAGEELCKFASKRHTGKKVSDSALSAAGYVYACNTLLECSENHYIVYGEWNFDNGPPIFELKGHAYFDEKNVVEPVESIITSESGWTEVELGEYLRQFVKIKLYGAPSEAKGGEGEGESANAANETENYLINMQSTFIVGVSPEGVFMISLPVVAPILMKLVARLKLKSGI
jgi:hypothetical protein